MQQHTERRSANTGCELSVTTLAVLERPPPASLVRRRVSFRRSQLVARRQALLQESILETTPSQTSADGRSTGTGSFQASAFCLINFGVITGGSTFSQALFNSVNIMLGVGMLSIPYALKEVSLGSHAMQSLAKGFPSDLAESLSALDMTHAFAGRMGNIGCAWATVDLHQLHWQGMNIDQWNQSLMLLFSFA